MEHEKTIAEYDSYRNKMSNLDTYQLWRMWKKEDKKFMFAMYGTKETGSKEALRADDERRSPKALFRSLEKTLILTGLLKERPEQERNNLYRHVRAGLCLANAEGKEAINIYLGFIRRELKVKVPAEEEVF